MWAPTAFADGTTYGDPNAATALPDVAGAEQPPLRVLFGAAPAHLLKQECADCERLSVAADGG